MFHVKHILDQLAKAHNSFQYVSRETITVETIMKLIILDRDGVLNQDSDDYIKSPEEWVPIPGSLEAIARLCHANYRVVVATNQSGISRGLFDLDTLNQIHKKMHRLSQEIGGMIEAVFFCPSKDDSNPCRKPNPGMLVDISRRLNVDLKSVPVVGDSLRDIQAAKAVGATPILVRTGKGKQTLASGGDISGIPVFDDLAVVTDYLLADPEQCA